mgnify:CR=1 FL=1
MGRMGKINKNIVIKFCRFSNTCISVDKNDEKKSLYIEKKKYFCNQKSIADLVEKRVLSTQLAHIINPKNP